MRIGFIGLGKLGYPCAVATSMKGHDVMGYDVDPARMNNNPKLYEETAEDGVTHINQILPQSKVRFGSLEEVVRHGEIVFVAVQTPHQPAYEGTTRLTDDREDFDYHFLVDAMKNISQAVDKIGEEKIVVVISTVLPGTMRKHVMPILSPKIKLCYNPYFIAMGTTIRDFLYPEFILLGVHDPRAPEIVTGFYATITHSPVVKVSVENAELIKVAYNTFIGMKIVFANVIMEICHKTPGTDVDVVMNALKKAHRRLIAPSYLDGGMGDGGGCHPRDNIALSWLARELDLSFDWFESVMVAREKQTAWLADLMESYNLPKAILGTSFKANSNILTGSPAILLRNILEERGHRVFTHDPVVEKQDLDLTKMEPMVWLLGSKHDIFRKVSLPKGSVLLDPWRFCEYAGEDVKIVGIGAGV